MKPYSLWPHLTLARLSSPTSTVTMPSGSRRIISEKSFAVMSTAEPGWATSASMFM